MIKNLDQSVEETLTYFVDEVFRRDWYGREREAISLYAFEFLLPTLVSDNQDFHSSQLGIEIAVPQLNKPGSKSQVNKDLVIWPKPYMTCWDSFGEPTQTPAFILEWKANTKMISDRDIEWLSEFSTGDDDFIGYAVTFDLKQRLFRLRCDRIHKGKRYRSWLEI